MPIDRLKRAIEIREQIDALTLELNELTGVPQFIAHNGARSNKPHGLTPAGRARIAAAQRLRWSRYSAHHHEDSTTAFAPKKNRLSAAGRAKVSAAVKARWERYRAAKARAK